MRCTTGIISVIIVITSAFMPVSAENGIVFSGEEDTLSLYNRLSSGLLKDPSGENSCRNIIKLMELSREAGREKTAKLFRKCADYIKERNDRTNPLIFILNHSAELLDDDSDTDYEGIDKWLVSGPWQKFGRADLYYPFIPEAGRSFSEFKSIKVEQGSRIYPFGFIPERRGIVYASASFSADVPVRIWIESNAEYRLFINSAEVLSSGIEGTESLSGVTVEGSREYSLLLKISDNRKGEDPFFRVIVTDLKNGEIKTEITGAGNRGEFSHKEIFSSCRVKSLPGFPGRVKMEKIRQSITDSNFTELYSEAEALVAEYPLCGESYHTIFPLLIQSGREKDFIDTVSRYRGKFPASDYYLKWIADFYQWRDEKKFKAAMDKIHPRYCDYSTAKRYIKLLTDNGDRRAARRYSEKFENIPSFRIVKAEVEKSLSTPVQWRKYLLEKISETGDPLYYYYMGESEMEAGLDPLLYWAKGLSIRGDMREMRDSAEIFENGSGSGGLFYSGRYTDFHPEFLWNGIKRKVTVRIFANGNYMTECEELIPSALAEKGGFSLLKLYDLSVLYALRCSGGEAFPQEYEVSEKGESVSVKLKDTGKADFFVLKYSGYSAFDQYPFYLMKDTELKREGEDISEVMLEVKAEGIVPDVSFMDKKIPGGESGREGETVYRVSEKFNYKNSERVVLSAAFKADYRGFAKWYSSMLNILKKKGVIETVPGLDSGDIQSRMAALNNYIKKNYITEPGINFEPRFPSDIVISGKGTTEELALLASVISEKAGIKGFVAFIKEKGDYLSANSEAALFIPESKGRGIWVRFADRKKYKNPEALLITGDNFEIIPVRDK